MKLSPFQKEELKVVFPGTTPDNFCSFIKITFFILKSFLSTLPFAVRDTHTDGETCETTDTQSAVSKSTF